MKGLILAAGYGTRLYPLTERTPKGLLPIAGRPLASYIMDQFERLRELDRVVVVTNERFAPAFQAWADQLGSQKTVTVLSNGTRSDAERLGAIVDLARAVDRQAIRDDLLVVAGDNLFDFDVAGFVDFAKTKLPSSSLAVYDLQDREGAKRYGVVRLADSGQVLSFQEKPAEPESTLVALAVYYFSPAALALLPRYLREETHHDQPGYLVAWLARQAVVYGYCIRGMWYDIGDLEAYQEADRAARRKGGGRG